MNIKEDLMNGKDRLLHLWRWLKVPSDDIRACSRDYDLLCPHCRGAGRGEIHLKVLSDDSGFRCVALGHEYRWLRNAGRVGTPALG